MRLSWLYHAWLVWIIFYALISINQSINQSNFIHHDGLMLSHKYLQLCAPAGYRVTLFGNYLIPNPAHTSWVKLAYNYDENPTPPKDLKMAILVEIDCSETYHRGTSGALVDACFRKLGSILNPPPESNLEIV